MCASPLNAGPHNIDGWERRARTIDCPYGGAPQDYPCSTADAEPQETAHPERYVAAMVAHPDYAWQKEEFERIMEEEGR